MRIAVMGTGGVGGGFGAALAKAGADVTFIARGAHLAVCALWVDEAKRILLLPKQLMIRPASVQWIW